MPLPPKPSDHITWTDGSPSKVTEPSSGKKLLGWTAGERPPFQYMNWLFWQLDNWDTYLEAATDFLLAQPLYDALVDGVHYADLNAVMADSGIGPGARILVSINLTIATIQQITKNNCLIDFKPGITWVSGASATGIQVSATGTRLRGGRLTGFGTAAILIDAGSNYTLVGEWRFAGNTNDITDNNGTGTTYGLIPE